MIWLLIVLLAIGGVTVSHAQSGTCPDWTNELYPVPPGTYPGTSRICVAENEGGEVGVVYNGTMPCGGGTYIDPDYETMINNEWPRIVIVPPQNQQFPSGYAKIGWQMSSLDYLNGNYDSYITYNVETFDSTGVQIDATQVTSTNFPFEVGFNGTRFYEIEATLEFSPGGFFTMQVIDPEPIYVNISYGFGIIIVDGYSGLSQLRCNVPGAATPTPSPVPSATPTVTGTLPPTNTPQPTNTLDPSVTPNTATPTPQSFPTAPGGTITPLPTPTMLTFVTVPALPTPTAWGTMVLPTLDLGEPSFGGGNVPGETAEAFGVQLTMQPTISAFQTQIAENINRNNDMAEFFYTEEFFTDTLDISGTMGISTPVEIAGIMAESITTPIAYVKMIQFYLPNIWPLLFGILLMATWVFFILFVKFAIAVISEALELLRRLIELIPFI